MLKPKVSYVPPCADETTLQQFRFFYEASSMHFVVGVPTSYRMKYARMEGLACDFRHMSLRENLTSAAAQSIF